MVYRHNQKHMHGTKKAERETKRNVSSSAAHKKWTLKKGVEVVELKKGIHCVFCIRKG